MNPELFEAVKWLAATVLSAIPIVTAVRKLEQDAEKLALERKEEAPTKTALEEKRVDAEVTETIMNSATNLMETYHTLLESLDSKYTNLMERYEKLENGYQQLHLANNSLQTLVGRLQIQLNEEIAKRESAQRQTYRLLLGVGRLIHQLKERGLDPVWEPEDDLLKGSK